ncbi:hypothetical protein ACT691_11105 [Vibrio metschnikovii]
MNTVVIVDCLRTPMGRSKGGAFRHQRAEDLGSSDEGNIGSTHKLVNPQEIEDIYWAVYNKP